MSFLTPARVAIALLVAESLVLVHAWLSSGFVLFSELSLDKSLVAQVSIRRDFPYLSVQGYLDIRDALTGEVRKHVFLVARDVPQDVAQEIHSVAWRGNAVLLDVEGVHYSGPKEFEVR